MTFIKENKELSSVKGHWQNTKVQKEEFSGHINYNHSESGVCGANEYELNTYVW